MNYRYFTFLTERDTIMRQGRERLFDAGKGDCHETDGGYD